MALRAGDELLNGKYRIERQIGQGGFALVYLGHDTIHDHQVAIKELVVTLVHDKSAIDRFMAEGKAAKLIRHPNVVEVCEVFPEGDNYYIAMEYLPGGSLQDRLRKKGSLSVDEALRIMGRVCAGLAYAHQKGVVHCDIKPANILFAVDGTAKVADFGIAHVSADLMTRVWRTATQFSAGTLQYVSPEQLEGKRDDSRVDVYALGAVLYEMLAGKPYLGFEAESTPAAQVRNAQRITQEAPRPLPSRVPSWLRAVVMKALGKRAESRYADAGELKKALLGTEAPAIPPAAPPTALDPGSGIENARQPAVPSWLWPAVGGVGALLVLTLVLVFFAGLGRGTTVPASGTEPVALSTTAVVAPTDTSTPGPTATTVVDMPSTSAPTSTRTSVATPTPTNTPTPVSTSTSTWVSSATATQTPSVNLEATAVAMATHSALEATIIAGTPRFSQVHLEPIANWPLDGFLNPPTGQVSFAEIPFTILTGRRSIFQTQHHLLMDLPIQGSLQVSIGRPLAVHILMHGAYVEHTVQDRKVGEIALSFADDSTLSIPIIAWQCIREGWAYEDDPRADFMSEPGTGVQWRNVWVEQQNRGDKPARAFIDMTTLSIPEPHASSILTSITIRDTSVGTVGYYYPSIVVMAITVESRQQL